MKKNKTLIILHFFLAISSCESLRLLVFFPGPSKSHSLLGRAVANHLLEAGHEVVFFTTYPSDDPHTNLTQMSLNDVAESFRSNMLMKGDFKVKNLVGKKNKSASIFILYYMHQFHQKILEQPQLVNFFKDRNESFDAVIIEWFFVEALAGIAPLFNCPLIWFASSEVFWQTLQVIDDIPNPAYSVDIFSTNRPPLDFWQRAEELWSIVQRYIVYSIVLTPLEKSLYNRVFSQIATSKGISMPSYNDAVYNGSFLLINSHPSSGTAFRLPQNAKYIGGYHIDGKIKPLPTDLQIVMDNAKHGIIYFSLGSNLQSADMSDSMKLSLLKIFGKLKETVIWKFEADLEAIPANVHLVKWAPQQSILAHNNTKVFITHGGQLSTIEAIHFAVPVLGIPIAADQYLNMRSVVEKGFGIIVPLTEEMPTNLELALKEMLMNSMYKAKVTQLSLVYHDRPNPGDELVYWVEHVVKTGGAPHLRSPALSLPFYKKLYLDLASFVIVILVCLIKLLRYSLNKLRLTKKSDFKRKTK